MKEEKLIELIHKRATNELTEAESQQLDTALKSKDTQALAHEVEDVWEKSLNYHKDYQPDVEAGLSRFKSQLEKEKTSVAKVIPMSSRRSWLRGVAVAVVLLAGTWLSWNLFSDSADWQQVATAESRKELKLQDGTQVWINADSEFEYPKAFAADQRAVRLYGEAFFDVAKHPEKPFVIESGDLKIEVLGTSFNVRNFDNEHFATITVRSGKVRVSDANGAFIKTLEANDRLVFDKRKMKLQRVDKDENLNELAWWSGKIQFSNEKISRIKSIIEHAYRVELEFTNPELLKCSWTISNDLKSEGLEAIFVGMKLGLALDKYEKVSENSYRLVGGTCNY